MSPTFRSTSRGADLTKGAISLIGLVALVVVVPFLLIRFIGWPLPRAVPSIDEVTTALGDRYVPDRFLVGALAVVCWLIWAELVASVVVEVIAHARGRTAAQVPLALGTQRAAARLVAGVALLAALFASRGEPAPAVRVLTPAPVAAAQVEASLADAPVVADDAVAAAPTYTVQQRDTLWDISERCLGDPFRWNEIWNLNQHRTMVDGRPFSDPDRIQPGWVLALPGDATVGRVEAATLQPATPAAVGASVGSDASGAAGATEASPGTTRTEVLEALPGDPSDLRVEVLAPLDAGSSTDPGTPAPDPHEA